MTFGNSGPRSNAYSRSKFTNWSRYNPWDMEVDKALRGDWLPDGPFRIKKFPVHNDFIMPLTSTDVEDVLDKLGGDARMGLKRVLLLGGTSRQKTFGKKGRFGVCYFDLGIIAIHAIPKHLMQWRLKNHLSPHQRQEFERVGADFLQSEDGLHVKLGEEAIHRFLKFDVLIHELGHHLDRANIKRKKNRKTEGFAEWFVVEHGFRKF